MIQEKLKSSVTKSTLVLTVLLMHSTTAHAYIDPGSGSAILAGLIGFFVALFLALQTYWYKLRSFFVRRFNPADQQEKNTPADQQEKNTD